MALVVGLGVAGPLRLNLGQTSGSRKPRCGALQVYYVLLLFLLIKPYFYVHVAPPTQGSRLH